MTNSISQYVSKNGNKVDLNGIDLDNKNNYYLLENLSKNYREITECNVNNCNLKYFPKELMELKKISILDIRNNDFNNFEVLVESLTIYNNLTDLKIDLINQNQVILLLNQIPQLILLNGKSTKDTISIIDIEQKDIEDISLENELPLFNEIINKINSIELNENLQNNFQSKFNVETEQLKLSLNNNIPLYIYANKIIKSTFNLYKYLSEQFIEKLNEKYKGIASLLFNNIFNYGEKLIKIINLIHPKIEEKFESLRSQLEEALKSSDNNIEFEQKLKTVKKEKDILSNENNLIQNKLILLENENKLMSEKLLNNAKEIYEKNKNISPIKEIIDKNNNINKNTILNINKNILPITPKVLSLKNAKEIMNEIYNNKIIYDKKCNANKLSRETMEQFMYTYLFNKYGLKNLIIEWAAAIINAIKLYSNTDIEINLFGKILRNEQEEESRFLLDKLKNTVLELIEYYLKIKNPFKSKTYLQKMLNNKIEGLLNEEEWKGIIYYIFTNEEAQIIEKKILLYIQKLNEKNDNNQYLINENNNNNNNISNNLINIIFNNNYSKSYSSPKTKNKLTREEIFNLVKNKEEMNILYYDFINIIGNYQVRNRDKYLKNFVTLFRKFDIDGDGILNEKEFIELIKSIPYCQKNIEINIFKFLSIVDPFNNKKITFSDCILLFSMDDLEENENENSEKTNLLDKICLNNNM